MSDPEPFLDRAARRLRRDGWLVSKSMRQRLARLGNPSMPKLTVFVAGLQRSGTNMLMDAYERSPETDVYHESDTRAFQEYQLREVPVLRRLVDGSPARVVVVKALLDGERVRALMDEFAPAKAIWMFRHFSDVINSNMVNWRGGRNQIEDIVRDRNAGDWRGRGMTDETHEMVKRHFKPGMNDASALALFYVYRHQLFFDQALESDPRVCLMNYEELVSTPDQAIPEVAAFSDLQLNPRMWSHIHARSINRAPSPEVSDDIAELAEAMYQRLLAARRDKAGQSQAA